MDRLHNGLAEPLLADNGAGGGGVGSFSRSADGTPYAIVSSRGLQPSELLSILAWLCRVEIALSVMFMLHGSICPGFEGDPAYRGMCDMNVVAALVGAFTGAVGLGALHRLRWRGMSVIWLVMAIISAVAFLVTVINCTIWMLRLAKNDERSAWDNAVSVVILLVAVALGVCYVISSAFVCHQWNSTATRYQVIGKITRNQRTTARYSPTRGYFDVHLEQYVDYPRPAPPPAAAAAYPPPPAYTDVRDTLRSDSDKEGGVFDA